MLSLRRLKPCPVCTLHCPRKSHTTEALHIVKFLLSDPSYVPPVGDAFGDVRTFLDHRPEASGSVFLSSRCSLLLSDMRVEVPARRASGFRVLG